MKRGERYVDIKQLIGETTDYDKKLALKTNCRNKSLI